MTLKPGEDIGMETHPKNDQFFRFEGGKGKCTIDGNEYDVKDGDDVLIPAGAKHNVKNTDLKDQLKMYTIYGPPNHQDGTIRTTKAEAIKKDEEFDGKTSE
jgi:mannose-6-phosphate isomerase-like protein (cupin superfamily)